MVSHLLRRLALARRARNSFLELSRLTDEQLRDIGLERGNLPRFHRFVR